jgi:hypothetical protein
LKVVWSFEEFKAKFSKAGQPIWFRMGLVVFKGGRVLWYSKPRQSFNARCGWNSILGMDVWEHMLLLALSKQKT